MSSGLRRVLITGGASGIGRATVLELARDGVPLVIADRSEEDGRRVAEEARATGADASFIPCDVTDEASCAALAQAVRQRWEALDVLICCAGILRGAYVNIDQLDTTIFDQVLDVNLRGTFLSVKHAVPLLRGGIDPLIILVASGAGVIGGSSSIAYGSSKGGVHGLSLVLDQHLRAAGVRVLDVCPGNVDTPLKRENVRDAARARGADPETAVTTANLTDPAMIGKVMRFLASSEGAAVRGTIFTR